MAARFKSVQLGPNDSGRRFDRVARKVLSHLPLSRVYSAIRSGDIRLNGRKARGNARVASGDTLDVRSTLAGPLSDRLPSPAVPGGEAERGMFASRIVYESPHILVVNKLRGELVHSGAERADRDADPPLAELVEHYLRESTLKGASFRPGPLHRLDRNTSGLVMFSVSLRGAQEVSRALRERRVRKAYVALLSGDVREPVEWEEMLWRDQTERTTVVNPQAGGARVAQSIVVPVARADRKGPDGTGRVTLALIEIVTGRTHQIRAQAAHNGYPLLGDRKYGGAPLAGGYILHAGALEIMPEEVSAPDAVADIGRLWASLPQAAERQAVELFGESVTGDLYQRLAGGE